MTNMPTTNERYWGPSGTIKNPKWDPDGNETELKKLHGEGFSAGKIARKLGFSSRNAVIGKLHRLGIVKSRPVGQHAHLKAAPTMSRGEKIAKGLNDFATAKRINEQKQHKPRVRLTEDLPPPIAPEMPILPNEFDEAIPVEQRRTLLELTSFTCRWPCGNPASNEFYFCGGQTDLVHVYCHPHTMRATRR
jgi:GcrA cell cycle regulator